MDNGIQKIYKALITLQVYRNYLNLLNRKGINATAKDIQTFLDTRVAVQQTKII